MLAVPRARRPFRAFTLRFTFQRRRASLGFAACTSAASVCRLDVPESLSFLNAVLFPTPVVMPLQARGSLLSLGLTSTCAAPGGIPLSVGQRPGWSWSRRRGRAAARQRAEHSTGLHRRARSAGRAPRRQESRPINSRHREDCWESCPLVQNL